MQSRLEHEADQIIFGTDTSELPKMANLTGDESRQEPIRSMIGASFGIGTDTSIADNTPEIGTYTEYQALNLTNIILEDAITHPRISEDLAEQAEDIYENISFIGEKELAQATQSIATYWKSYLSQDASNSIFVITSRTFELESSDDETKADEDYELGHVSDNKSDSYILNKVLSNFSDDELREYGDRLLLSVSDFLDKGSRADKAIILDDWIMSGQQIKDTIDIVLEHVGPLDLEVNLVACSQDRLSTGLIHGDLDMPIPVKAYFATHSAKHPYALDFGGSYLTATHSSGDYPFEGALENIVGGLNQVRSSQEDMVYMPPLTNIIRPYYTAGYRFEHIERHKNLRSIGKRVLSSV